MNQDKSQLRLPVQGAVDRTANYAAMTRGGVESSQDLQQLITGIAQALPLIIGAFL